MKCGPPVPPFPLCSSPPPALLHIPLPSADLACPTGGGGSSSTVIFSKGRIWAAARAVGQLFLIWSWPGDDPPVGASLSGKTKTPAPSKGAPWQRWRARNRLAKGKQGNRKPALRNICTAFLCKREKKMNTVCISPRDLAKTWEGWVSFFCFRNSVYMSFFSFVHFPFWLTISWTQQLPHPLFLLCSPPLSPGLLHLQWKPTLDLGGAGLGPCYACLMMDGQEN